MKRFSAGFFAIAFFAAGVPASAAVIGDAAQLIHRKDYTGALSILASLQGRDSREDLSISYLSGYSLLLLGKKEDAKMYFETASLSPLIGDRAAFQLMKIQGDLGEYRDVIRAAETFPDRFPYSLLKNDVLVEKAKALRNTGLPFRAMAILKGLEAKNLSGQKDILWQMAQSQEVMGATEDAYKTYQRIYCEYAHLSMASAADTEMVRIRKSYKKYLPVMLPENMMKRASVLMANKMYRSAVAYINALDRAKFSPLHRAELMAHVGRANERLGNLEGALAAYRQAAKFRDREIRPEALYRIEKIHWNADENEKAIEAGKQIIKEFPLHETAALSHYIAARIDESAGRGNDAVKMFEHTAAAFPSSKVADDCMWYAGWLRHLSGDYEGAEKAFGRMAEKYPTANGASAMALYWQMHSMRQQGKNTDDIRAKLAAKFPFSYYTYLASGTSGISFRLAGDAPLNEEERLAGVVREKMADGVAQYAREPSFDEKHGWAYQSSQAWLAMGMYDIAKTQLDAAAPGVSRNPQGLTWLAWQYYRVKCHSCASRTIDLIRMEDLPPEQQQFTMLFIFPMAYWDIVASFARTYGIDPFIVLSIIRQESMFDPDIVSVANARGLMQLMLPTAEKMAGALKMENVTVEGLNDPETNIRLGAYYLAGLIKGENGELPFALATYNAGPNPVGRWKKRFPYDDISVFIERIPYSETRDYVKKVLRNYCVYRKIYMDSLAVTRVQSGK